MDLSYTDLLQKQIFWDELKITVLKNKNTLNVLLSGHFILMTCLHSFYALKTSLRFAEMPN